MGLLRPTTHYAPPVQGRIRHKRVPPTGYPHLFRFDLELVTLRAKELLSFALRSCSLVTSLPGIKRKTPATTPQSTANRSKSDS